MKVPTALSVILMVVNVNVKPTLSEDSAMLVKQDTMVSQTASHVIAQPQLCVKRTLENVFAQTM